MEEEEEKKRIQLIADTIEMLLQQVDLFTSEMTEDDFEILEECKQALKDKILTNNSALALIYACGGNYDDTEDRMKVKTLDSLIELMKARIEYKKEKIEIEKRKENQQDVLKLFGLMGMM